MFVLGGFHIPASASTFVMLLLACFISSTAPAYAAGAPAGEEGDGKNVAVKPHGPDAGLTELWSGYKFAAPKTRAMQDDDFENPGYLWVDLGEQIWNRPDGIDGRSCASCHSNPGVSMKDVGTRYPEFDSTLKKPVSLEQRINLCRTQHLKTEPFAWESRELLSLTTYLMNQARGLPMAVGKDSRLKPFLATGRQFYYARRGQLDMSCAQCHEQHFGEKLRQNTLSQGQANGFPAYRLKWQKPGSLHRRFAGCNAQVRAQPFALGSDEYVALELFLRWRGNGLPIETPAVRN